MDEAAIQRVVDFSIFLKKFADIVLNQQHSIVSIDTWTLYEIEEAFSLIFEVEKYTNFHVLPPSNRQHPSIPHIQFLYDILQKVKKLRILTKRDRILPVGEQINLKCFRSLCTLELDSVPINQLKGLQNVRPVLKHLKVFNVCSQMNEILLKCGADMATEYLWENLETANFSRNHLGHLDSSLRLLPTIKELDLSYCELVDAISLFCLPTITKLNLSYNKLTSVPALSENASNVLQSLNLSNNLIIDLRGIERFITLEELNLKENFISVEQTLVHLNDLTNLKYLNILRNPITYGVNYRNHVLQCLHSSIRACEQFILDDAALLFSERKVIGSTPERLQLKSSSSQLLKCLLDNVNKILRRQKTYCNRARLPPVAQLAQPVSSFKACKSSTETDREESSSDNTTNKLPARGSVRRKSRRNIVRHVSRTFEPPEDSSKTFEQAEDSSKTPEQAENSFNNSPISLEKDLTQASVNLNDKDSCSANNDFFNEQRNNLNFPPSHLEPDDDPDLCTLTKAPSPSDKLLEEILNSHSQNLLNKSFSSPNQSIVEPPDRTINSSSFQDCSSIVSSSNSSIYKLNDSFNLDVSPITTDDEELEPQRELYSVIAKWENKVMDKNVEVDSDFVFLSFTPHFYKEKNGLSKGTMVKLNISNLQSMEVLSTSPPIKVELNFNYPHPELSCRRFIFEEEDFKLLKDLIEPIIEKNKKNESKPPLPCNLCKLPFYGIKAQPSGTKDKKKFCRRCGNKKRKFNSLYEPDDGENIPEENLSFIRNINSNGKESNLPRRKQSESSTPERKTRNEKGRTSSDSSESVSICSSNGTSPGNQKHDHGSTPSLSSIEVLQENVAPDGEEKRYYEKGIPVFELPVTAESNIDIRTPPDKSDLKILRFVDSNGTMGSILSTTDTAAMQESSSSGSLSGSVCTTVDRLSSGPSTPIRHDGGEQNLKGKFSDSECETSVRAIISPDENVNLSSSIKSTDTVCHRPHSKSNKKTLKEVFEMFPEEDYDYDRKGIVLGDSCDVVSLKKWAKGLVGCYTSYSRESLTSILEEQRTGDSNRISDIPIFSYDDFTAVDHRLKLYCEVFLFTEHQEVLQGLFKAVVSTEDEAPFLGVLAISNRKIYILRITNEENDSPQEWLEVNVVCYLEEVPSLYTVIHKQGVVVKFKEKMVLLCLADSQRSNGALYFILNCLDRHGYHPGVDDKFCRAQSEKIRGQALSIRNKIDCRYNSESRDTVHLFQNVTLLHQNGECSNHFLVLTSTYIFLFEADLSWLSASRFKSSSLIESIENSTTDLVVTYSNRLDDVTQVDLYSDTHFQIEFYQQPGQPEKPFWMIHVASPWVACNFIQTLRPLWEDEMTVDLDIVCYSEDLTYIKEALRDSEFAPYIF